ncbi:ABC transporter permease subunit [Salinicola corii]|uniref:ABC transporter permease subunit n=1 Tax=Salinicola corii TaxID=2606937 RepID=A0A640WIJ8_9GAMM|nr:ABC transporter permease subunit [Salinicola corii]KAA0020410.1 ABC transporter permease subunit [Salinicola corii]
MSSNADRRRSATGGGLPLHWWILAPIFVSLSLPLAATLLYALATRWGATLLPDGLTLDWMLRLWHTPRFLEAFGRSMFVVASSLLLSLVLILPVAFLARTRFPWLERWMDVLVLTPFAVPPVVSSVGLLQLYAGGPLPLVGTPWILIFTYVSIALPFMYRSLINSLRGFDAAELMDAAQLLGASPLVAFLRVVLPNMRLGIRIAVFLSFSFLIGEFVFANLLVGTRFETLQIYLFNVRRESGHFTSALVITLFLFILILTWLGNGRSEVAAPKDRNR